MPAWKSLLSAALQNPKSGGKQAATIPEATQTEQHPPKRAAVCLLRGIALWFGILVCRIIKIVDQRYIAPTIAFVEIQVPVRIIEPVILPAGVRKVLPDFGANCFDKTGHWANTTPLQAECNQKMQIIRLFFNAQRSRLIRKLCNNITKTNRQTAYFFFILRVEGEGDTVGFGCSSPRHFPSSMQYPRYSAGKSIFES